MLAAPWACPPAPPPTLPCTLPVSLPPPDPPEVRPSLSELNVLLRVWWVGWSRLAREQGCSEWGHSYWRVHTGGRCCGQVPPS